MDSTSTYRKRDAMPFFGERLHQAIKLRGTSQRKLGKEIKVEPGRISEYKTGRRQPDAVTAEKIATALNVPLDYLYGRIQQLELLDLSDAEVKLVLNVRAGSKHSLDDAMDAKMDGSLGN